MYLYDYTCPLGNRNKMVIETSEINEHNIIQKVIGDYV
jgi:hypothetical protein